MDKRELIANLKEDLEAFGEDKTVYTQWIGKQLVNYSYVQERKCVDPETIGNLLAILED